MSDAIPSKSDAADGNPDVVYIPDPPGLMKSGGLHPIAVTLPLELEGRLRALTLLRVAFAVFLLAFIIYAATARHHVTLGVMAAMCLIWFCPALVSLSNRLLHHGPVLLLSGGGIDYRLFNEVAFSCRWADVAEARFVGVMEPEYPSSRDVLRLRLQPEAKSPSIGLLWLSYSLPWPFALRWHPLPKSTVLLPINDLEMPSEDVRYTIEELLRRHGKSVA